MYAFLNNAVVWFGIGFVFFLLEFILPGFILFFFGLGAWIVAILTLFTQISINIQLLIFLASSFLSVLLFRKWLKDKLGVTKRMPQVLENEFVGRIAIAETPIGPGLNGRVNFKGTSWDASSEDTIAAGENVTIIETRSILLIVKLTPSL